MNMTISLCVMYDVLYIVSYVCYVMFTCGVCFVCFVCGVCCVSFFFFPSFFWAQISFGDRRIFFSFFSFFSFFTLSSWFGCFGTEYLGFSFFFFLWRWIWLGSGTGTETETESGMDAWIPDTIPDTPICLRGTTRLLLLLHIPLDTTIH